MGRYRTTVVIESDTDPRESLVGNYDAYHVGMMVETGGAECVSLATVDTTTESAPAGARLLEWHALHRRRLNGLSLVPNSTPYQAPEPIQRAVYHFLLRVLSRGHVPDPRIALDAFEGRRAVPACGVLECAVADEHTH